MSVPVPLPGLSDRIDERGPAAFLVTVNEDQSAHVVSVLVAVGADELHLPAGRTTRRNAERNSAVTLLWAAGPDDPYSLIVDADVLTASDDDGGHLVVAPRSAILHRMAGRGDGPTCLPVDSSQATG